MLLQQWHNLSDPELDESLRVRLDFMLFTGFELLEEIPDETTICRFRNKLTELRLEKKLFEEINGQLEKLGLKVKQADGAVIDATIIESSAKPNRIIEMSIDRQESIQTDLREDTHMSMNIKESADPDARWLKKGKKSYFGYKGFISTEVLDGYIMAVHVTSANESECNKLEQFLEHPRGTRIYADKGYASGDNTMKVKQRGLKDGIMQKASRGHALTFWQKLRNKLISKKRFIVEQAFGTLKRMFEFTRSRYMSRVKVEAQMVWKAMCLNLLKASNKAQ